MTWVGPHWYIISIPGDLYIGGVRQDIYATNLPDEIQSRFGFRGCLATLNLNGVTPDLIYKDVKVKMGRVTPGCSGLWISWMLSYTFSFKALCNVFKSVIFFYSVSCSLYQMSLHWLIYLNFLATLDEDLTRIFKLVIIDCGITYKSIRNSVRVGLLINVTLDRNILSRSCTLPMLGGYVFWAERWYENFRVQTVPDYVALEPIRQICPIGRIWVVGGPGTSFKYVGQHQLSN